MDTMLRRDCDGPLRVVAIGSNGPHHRYLFSALAERFDLVGVIVEQADPAGKRLFRAGRYVDGLYALLHQCRQRLLGYRGHRRAFFGALGPFTEPADVRVVRTVNDPEVTDALREWAPEITVVFCVSILRPPVLAAAGTAINVHAGYLPNYRGNQGVFMPLYRHDQEHVGASLHLVTPKVDAGPLIAVVRPPLRPTDNEETVWCRAIHRALVELLATLERYEHGEPVVYRAQPPGPRAIRNRDRGLWMDLRWMWRLLTRRQGTRWQSRWRIEYADGRTVTEEWGG